MRHLLGCLIWVWSSRDANFETSFIWIYSLSHGDIAHAKEQRSWLSIQKVQIRGIKETPTTFGWVYFSCFCAGNLKMWIIFLVIYLLLFLWRIPRKYRCIRLISIYGLFSFFLSLSLFPSCLPLLVFFPRLYAVGNSFSSKIDFTETRLRTAFDHIWKI